MGCKENKHSSKQHRNCRSQATNVKHEAFSYYSKRAASSPRSIWDLRHNKGMCTLAAPRVQCCLNVPYSNCSGYSLPGVNRDPWLLAHVVQYGMTLDWPTMPSSLAVFANYCSVGPKFNALTVVSSTPETSSHLPNFHSQSSHIDLSL